MARLDVELVRRRLVPTRSAARRAVVSGWVTVDGSVATRPAATVDDLADLAVDDNAVRYVSRGGHKLAGALDVFGLDASGRSCLDIGASTGGFTDVLLQRGAVRVVAVDVGTDQLHPTLRTDDRVVSLESTDIRDVAVNDVAGPFDLVAVDVSFISLHHLVAVVGAFLASSGDAVVLVKPQFEVGRAALRKDGVVGDMAVAAAAVAEVVAAFRSQGLFDVASLASPIAGSAGNQETLVHFRHEEQQL